MDETVSRVPTRETTDKGVMIAETANITDTSSKIIIDNSPYPCKPVLEYVINNPGCRALDVQLSLGLHRGNPRNLEKRKEITDCLEILCFAKYLEKKGNQYYPLPKAWIVNRNTERKFIPGLDPSPIPGYGRE